MRVTQIIILLVAFNVSVAFVILVRLLLTDLEVQTFQATEEVMVDSAKRMAEVLEAEIDEGKKLVATTCEAVFPEASDVHEMDIEIYGVQKQKVGIQYYVVNGEGVVVFDSQPDHFQGEDFSEYNDVVRTMRGEYGARSTRTDEADASSSFLYVGSPVRKGGEIIGVLTLYKAQADVEPFVRRRRGQILQVCMFMGLGTVLFVSAVFFWVYRPIGMLTGYAKGVIEGRRPAFPKLGKGREINTLGTALKQMRETLEGRDYAKNYVQTLSHELKSPISAIKATAELLQEDVPPEQRKRFLKSIVSEVERSEKAITRLQQLSEIEKMAELERIDSVSLDRLLNELAAEYTEAAKAKEIKVDVEGPSVTITGDLFLLRAVFQNLIDNAVKFAPPQTKVVIKIGEEENVIVISVENQGDEIPEYARERIFERLYSLGDGATGKGSGIGLALVTEAVSLHHGKVFYTHEGGQNVFKVSFPKGEVRIHQKFSQSS